MASRFRGSYGTNGQSDMLSQFGEFKNNPTQFLADRGINVPPEYAGNPQMMAQYLLSNMPAYRQNGIFRTATMIKQMLGL